MRLRLEVPLAFSLQRAVCSYGFFMMAPNSWSYDAATLERPLRLSDGQSIITSVSENRNGELIVEAQGRDELDEHDRQTILAQVKRMLRLSPEEDAMVNNFHALHSDAKSEGFGRLFRSPTLFEDMIKSLLLCNCGWPRTLQMTRALCELQAELKGAPLGCTKKKKQEKSEAIEKPAAKSYKRKAKTVFARSTSRWRAKELQQKFSGNMEAAIVESEVDVTEEAEERTVGAFPTPEELAELDPEFVAKRCGLGYRAGFVMKLATGVSSGTVQLSMFEGPEALSGLALKEAILELSGFGPFSCANVMMLLGNYDVIPADTETIRHLKAFHGKKDVNKSNVAQVVATIYEHCKPFEFLAYWWEIWRSYEKRFGDLAKMPPTDFRLITGASMRKHLCV